MGVTTFGKIIKQWQGRVMTMAFGGVLILVLITQLPVAGQQQPQETTPAAAETTEQLQQLVAPIALYPDALVAQILAAATYPTEVVNADRWLQQHANLQGEQLATVVDQQSWDPSVKALTAFPSVLANMDKNLSWTEALGDAYFNQQQDVLDAVQMMRRRAEDAGNLRSTSQEQVVNQGPTIVIEPVDPGICYLPIYDPWIVYGAPLVGYPGYFYDSWYGPPFISYGPAIRLGFFGGFGWGWPSWGFNWGRRVVVFNHNTYVSRSRFFARRGPFFGGRGVVGARRFGPSVGVNRSFNNRGFNNRYAGRPNSRFGNGWANRGPAIPRANTGPGSRAFNGVRPGGFSRGPGFSREAGGASLGGGRNLGGSARGGGGHFGGGARGGGGSFGGGGHGGGSHGGGGRGGGGGRHR
jgi:hypothetical protein